MIQIKGYGMFNTYFQLGKDFIKNKLQKFEPTVTEDDYIQDKIPNRLKEPLSVLQQEEIDIEDSQAYETYYKNYPNHHLSHFLLDKYNTMVEAEAEVTKYLLPGGSNSHVPSFDEKLQEKALLLREAIEQYDEGFTKNDEPIICISVINFHHKRGVEAEYRFPDNKAVLALEPMLVHHAMPDSSHNKHEDYNFFNFEAEYKGKKRMLFGVSYFKQIKITEEMKNENVDLTRSYLQKAVAILSTLPLFGYLKIKLAITTKVFFVKFTNFDIIEQAYKEINKHMAESWPNLPITDLYIGSDLKSIISLFEITDFYEIWKAVLYQKRIVVYGHSSSSVSTFLLSLLSLFPGQSTFGIFSKPIAKYMQSLRQLALPLKLFNSESFLYYSFHIQDFSQLDKFKKSDKGNFLLGTTNRLLKQSKDYGIQLLVNLQNCTIEKRQSRRPTQPLSKKQRKFLSELSQIINRQKGEGYGSSQDCIRNHFYIYLKASLIATTEGIKQFEKFKNDCRDFAAQHKSQDLNSQPKLFPPLLPEQTRKIPFPELLLKKSFAYFRQFSNKNLPQIVKGEIIPSLYINNYDYFLRLPNQEFISYNWQEKKLSFGKGVNPKNFQGKQIKFKISKDEEGNELAKSLFIGKMTHGKFNASSFYIDEFQRYEGQYNNGIKEGYGKLLVGEEKYIGNFLNNLFEGQGQLLIGTEVYVGQFKKGLKNGYGVIQGGKVNFEGIWQNDKPKISSSQIRAKQQRLQKQIKDYKNIEEGQQQQTEPDLPPKQQKQQPQDKIEQKKNETVDKSQQVSHQQPESKKNQGEVKQNQENQNADETQNK